MNMQKYIREERVKDTNFILHKLKFLTTPTELIDFFSEYIAFNKIFSPGVLSLCSKINTCNLFKESDTSVITANILYAAIDEYYDNQLTIKTHSNLSDDFFNSILFFYKKELEEKKHKETNSLAINNFRLSSDILSNYLHSSFSPSEKEIFYSLGFHVAAENFGNIEFNCLDYILQHHFKDLYTYLNLNNMYTWIEVHKNTEEIHCNYAIDAITLSLKSYTGTLSASELNLFISEGYKSFVLLQNNFFKEVVK